MSYMALYRKFRPQTFNDVVGQEHIMQTLKNELETGRIAHAYLFSGGRGSGKTSTAKILARAVNCLHPVNGEPCNECEICKAALEGSLTDISEIDAASNNGVDNIRDIREEVEFIPTSAKYRVYIIDEVHMLSTGAFNALLKTLEEPPKHVIFILATTEPQKLPVTILSRCQRFEFKRISIENIMKRLTKICNESNIEIDDAALKIIAKMSDGAMRDAISILERCMADGDTKITEEKVRELIGIPEFEYLLNFAQDLIKDDVDSMLKDTEKIIDEGKNLEVFVWEEIKFLRDILMLKIAENLVSYKDEDIEKMKVVASICEKEKILRIIARLSELQNDMKWASDRDIIFETGLIKIIYDEKNKCESNLASTIENKRVVADAQKDPVKEKVLELLKENHKMIMHAILLNSDFEFASDDLMCINFSASLEEVNKQYMQREESKIAIKEVMQKALGRETKIKYVFK